MPRLSVYISLNCEIGSGFLPKPASIVNPGRLKSCINQSLKPAKLESYGVSATAYPLVLANLSAIILLWDGV